MDTGDLGLGLEEAGSHSQAGGVPGVECVCVWRGTVLRFHPRPSRAGCHCDLLEVPRPTKSRAEAEFPVRLGPKRPRARNATLELTIDQGRSGEEALPQLGGSRDPVVPQEQGDGGVGPREEARWGPGRAASPSGLAP